MTKISITSISLVLTSLALVNQSYGATQTATQQAFSNQQKQAIEQIVGDYLDRNPELIEATLKKALMNKERAKQEKTKQQIAARKDQIFNDPMSPTSGNANGTTSIAVFMDPFCGYCHQFQKVLNQVQAERKDLRIVYKVLPFLSKESKVAAREELAAFKQDRFLDYHEALFESTARANNQKSRLEIAKQIGIDVNKMRKDIRSAEITKAVDANQELAKALGISGTPAFIVNDTLIVGLVDADSLKKILDSEDKSA